MVLQGTRFAQRDDAEHVFNGKTVSKVSTARDSLRYIP